MRIRWTVPLLALSVGVACQSDRSCVGDFPLPCYTTESGRYLVQLPDDVSAPLPVFVYFHGYGGSASGQARRRAITQPLASRGVLGVFPDGLQNTWSHVGSPSQRRDELAFIVEIMDDLERRFDLDPDRRWVSGHSQGGSMAWDAACYRGGQFSALLPTSGAFWEPLPETCPAGPIPLRHTHGLNDTTVPMEGRGIGGSWEQGDVNEGVAIWRAVNGCPVEPDRVVEQGPETCQVWDSSCASGDDIWLCLHEGGHSAPDGWAGRALDWAEAEAAAR